MILAYARRAFTHIELLVVVAIIAILAAIVIPNIIEAQLTTPIASISTVMADVSQDNGMPDATSLGDIPRSAGVSW